MLLDHQLKVTTDVILQQPLNVHVVLLYGQEYKKQWDVYRSAVLSHHPAQQSVPECSP